MQKSTEKIAKSPTIPDRLYYTVSYGVVESAHSEYAML